MNWQYRTTYAQKRTENFKPFFYTLCERGVIDLSLISTYRFINIESPFKMEDEMILRGLRAVWRKETRGVQGRTD